MERKSKPNGTIKKTGPPHRRFSMADMWSRKVFVALLRRYDIRPYRYSGQRYTTVMANVSQGFVTETLWPQFQEIFQTLQAYLSEVTDRVVHQVIHQDDSDAEVVEKPRQLMPTEAASNEVVNSAPLAASTKTEDGLTGRKDNDRLKESDKHKRKKRKKRKRR